MFVEVNSHCLPLPTEGYRRRVIPHLPQPWGFYRECREPPVAGQQGTGGLACSECKPLPKEMLQNLTTEYVVKFCCCILILHVLNP